MKLTDTKMFEHANFKGVSLAVIFLSALFFGAGAFYVLLVLFVLFLAFKPIYSIPLLFLSGILKAAPFMALKYFDLTMLSLAVVSFLFLRQLKQMRWRVLASREVNFVLLAMLLVASVSIFFTPAPFQLVQRSGIFLIGMYIPLCLMIVNFTEQNANSEALIEALRNSVYYFGVPWIGLALHNQLFEVAVTQLKDPSSPVYHLSAFGEDYVAFLFFPVLVGLSAFADFVSDGSRGKVLNNVTVALCVILMLNSPGRGLFASFLISMMILLFNQSLGGKIKVAKVAYFALVTGSALFIYYQFLLDKKRQILMDRILDFSLYSPTFQKRLTAIQVGFENWKQSPFWGTGLDSVAYLNGDIGLYAHNYFCEVLFEFGALGAFPFIIFFLLSLLGIRSLLKAARESNDSRYFFLSGLGIVYLLYVQTSGTLGNNRQFWMISALVILIANRLVRADFDKQRTKTKEES